MGKFLDLTGQKFGRLIVKEMIRSEKYGIMWKCLCDCGKETTVMSYNLVCGNTKSCGCLRNEVASNTHFKKHIHELSGKQFNRLLAVKCIGMDRYGNFIWKCNCACGNTINIIERSLVSGNSQSCGCLHKERISGANSSSKRPETRKKLSDTHPDYSGTNNPNWKGGISYEPYCPKWTPDLRRRIRTFFNYECLICGKSQNNNFSKQGIDLHQLSCHHVHYNKQACCDGLPIHFAALCMQCHGKMNSKKTNWEYIIHRIIDELYDGRSYYTKEEWKKIKKSDY